MTLKEQVVACIIKIAKQKDQYHAGAEPFVISMSQIAKQTEDTIDRVKCILADISAETDGIEIIYPIRKDVNQLYKAKMLMFESNTNVGVLRKNKLTDSVSGGVHSSSGCRFTEAGMPEFSCLSVHESFCKAQTKRKYKSVREWARER